MIIKQQKLNQMVEKKPMYLTNKSKQEIVQEKQMEVLTSMIKNAKLFEMTSNKESPTRDLEGSPIHSFIQAHKSQNSYIPVMSEKQYMDKESTFNI
jgi:hypothetical protein